MYKYPYSLNQFRYPVSSFVLVFVVIIYGCSFANDTSQVTAMVKEFEEGGRMVAADINVIRETAKNVNIDDGVNKEEAEALVKDYLLDKHPQLLGWTVVVKDENKRWKITSNFAGNDEVIYIDKETAELMDTAFGVGFVHIPKK